MKLTFVNSADISVKERLVLNKGRRKNIVLKTRYGICIHPKIGPILIDAGFGPALTTGSNRSLGLKIYGALLSAKLIAEHSPAAVLSRMGYGCNDVGLVIITHFHADHIATLDQFPNARFLARRKVFDAISRRSYLRNFSHGCFPELFPDDFADRLVDIEDSAMTELPNDLGNGLDLLGDASLYSVDLPGHAEGHFGLFFPTLEKPLFYGVDSQWLMQAVQENRAPRFPISLIADDREAWVQSTAKLSRFQGEGGDILLCHDPLDSPYDWPNIRQSPGT